MDKTEVIEKVRRFADLVSVELPLKAVILFGSYAKGTERKDSDIDVAIVVKSTDKAFSEYAPIIWRLRRKIDTLIEPVVVEENNDPSGFLEEIYRTGIIVYPDN
jgi:predicted nucleotidyltransferase